MCARDRWRRLAGKICSNAAMSPGAPSVMTTPDRSCRAPSVRAGSRRRRRCFPSNPAANASRCLAPFARCSRPRRLPPSAGQGEAARLRRPGTSMVAARSRSATSTPSASASQRRPTNRSAWRCSSAEAASQSTRCCIGSMPRLPTPMRTRTSPTRSTHRSQARRSRDVELVKMASLDAYSARSMGQGAGSAISQSSSRTSADGCSRVRRNDHQRAGWRDGGRASDHLATINSREWMSLMGRARSVTRDCFRIAYLQRPLRGGELGRWSVMCRPPRRPSRCFKAVRRLSLGSSRCASP